MVDRVRRGDVGAARGLPYAAGLGPHPAPSIGPIYSFYLFWLSFVPVVGLGKCCRCLLWHWREHLAHAPCAAEP